MARGQRVAVARHKGGRDVLCVGRRSNRYIRQGEELREMRDVCLYDVGGECAAVRWGSARVVGQVDIALAGIAAGELDGVWIIGGTHLSIFTINVSPTDPPKGGQILGEDVRQAPDHGHDCLPFVAPGGLRWAASPFSLAEWLLSLQRTYRARPLDPTRADPARPAGGRLPPQRRSAALVQPHCARLVGSQVTIALRIASDC